MILRLQEMTVAGFSEYRPLAVESLAQAFAGNLRIPIEKARPRAASSIDGSLSSGLSTPDQFLYDIRLGDGTDDERIGYLWLDVSETEHRCFIHDIYLHEGYRGKGWGRKTLELLEAKMRERNIQRIGLHVWGDNMVARELYDKLGYRLIGSDMQKRLTP
jgi:ribosomal protein S18 acetylase RimI-like enzyme